MEQQDALEKLRKALTLAVTDLSEIIVEAHKNKDLDVEILSSKQDELEKLRKETTLLMDYKKSDIDCRFFIKHVIEEIKNTVSLLQNSKKISSVKTQKYK